MICHDVSLDILNLIRRFSITRRKGSTSKMLENLLISEYACFRGRSFVCLMLGQVNCSMNSDEEPEMRIYLGRVSKL